MNIKALFFDIDGTLVSFTSHTVPASTVEALEEAHRRGVGIYISTGRPMAFITNLKPIAHLIDGYITTNGAYCVVGDTVVSRHPMDPDDVATVLADAIDNHYPVVVDGERTIVVYNNSDLVDRIYVKGLGVDVLDYSLTLKDLGTEGILELSPFMTRAQEAALSPRLRHVTSGRCTPSLPTLPARVSTRHLACARWPVSSTSTSARPWPSATVATTSPSSALPASAWLWATVPTMSRRLPTSSPPMSTTMA